MIDKLKLKPKPYRLRSSIQHYAWGTQNEAAFIPRLIGWEPEADTPYAELWIGAHDKAPSELEVEGRWVALPEILETQAESLLGKAVAEQFNNRLPFLLKVLSAGEALSIQAHPNKAQAEALHKRDPEHYPDDNHKPEIAVALDSLTALAGFKTTGELLEVCMNYPEIHDFVKVNVMQVFRDKEGLKTFYTTLMKRAVSEPDALNEAIDLLQRRLLETKNPNETENLFLKLRKSYPGPDVGLFSLFILNLIHLNPGEGIFLKAGIPHAYIEGNIIECMANSDNVVRAGLTPKYKDIETLTDILTYETGVPERYNPDFTRLETIYNPPVPEFRLSRIQLSAIDNQLMPVDSKCKVHLVTEGKLLISWQAEHDFFQFELKKGETALVPAIMGQYQIKSVTDTQFFTVTIP